MTISLATAGQAVGYFSIFVMVSAYFVHDLVRFKLVSLASSTLQALSFALMHEMTSSLVCVVITLRLASSLRAHQYNRSRKMGLTATFLGMAVAASWITWQGPVSLLPLAASAISTVSSFFATSIVLRQRRFLSDALWITNAILLGNLASLISSLSSFAINAITLKKNIQYAKHP